MKRILNAHEKSLGEFSVRRALPYLGQKMIGPFIFFDHMGPAELPAGKGANVRPHPHINLATVTYLFEGKIRHRDSLGSDQNIEPGAINWMTAGHGIVHSERTPDELLNSPQRLHGIQLWVALPQQLEEIEPSFIHYPKESFTEFGVGGARLRLLLGEKFGHKSPVKVHSEMFYLECRIPAGQKLLLPHDSQEIAAYVVDGEVEVDSQQIGQYSMIVGDTQKNLEISARTDSHLMLLGGQALGTRFIDWNFVSSSQDRITQARADWEPGPRSASTRFKPVPGDQSEFIPLPKQNR
jgi:redox-sensitive bicupin YhaK (pirin superfamily)